jgi:SAM-dependent methyltransferase
MVYHFQSVADFVRFTTNNDGLRECIETYVADQDELHGYCPICAGVRIFRQIRPEDGGWSDLRERIVCECGMNGRMRMLYNAIVSELGLLGVSSQILIFEQITPFYRMLHDRFGSNVIGCEYVSQDIRSGMIVETPWGPVRHEDMCKCSITSDTVDIILHSDILEHVYDWKAALVENLRVLRPGGRLLFSTPAFEIEQHQTRALVSPTGVINLLAAAYHGNPMSAEGSLVFTDFALSLVDDLRSIGFSHAEICCDYSPFSFIIGNNCPYEVGRMWPIYFRAQK